MPKVTLLKQDLSKLALSKAGKTVFQLKAIPVEVILEIDGDLEKALKEDPLLQQQMVDKADKKLDQVAVGLGEDLKKIDAEIDKDTAKADELTEKAKKAVEDAATEAEKTVPVEVMKTWEKLKTRKAEYKKYKIKAGVKVATSAATLTASVVVTAVGGWTGAGTVLGIVGILKGVSGIAQQIQKLGKEAETVRKELEGMLDTVAERYKKAGVNEKGASELGAKVLEQLTTFRVASIGKCKDWDGLLKDKLNGVEVEAHDLAKDLNKALNEAEKADKELDKFTEKLMKASNSDFMKLAKDAGDLSRKLAKLQESIQKGINSCSTTAARAKEGRKAHGVLHTKVELLDQDIPQWSKVLQMATPVLDLAMTSDLNDLIQNIVSVAADVAQESAAYDKQVDKVTK